MENIKSFEQLKLIRDTLPMSQNHVANLLGVLSSTVARWLKSQKGPSKQEQKARLALLYEIIELGLKVYTPEGLQMFLFTPLPRFKNKTAYDLMIIGDFDSVLSALAADYEGLGY